MAKTMLHARIDSELHEWLKNEFPHGFIQTFVEECVENLRIMIEEGRIPAPREYSRRAAIHSVASLVQTQSEKEEDAGHS